MGGTPLLLALALVLVDYGWESDGRDGYRYIVQIPQEQMDAVEQAGVITSQIPEEIRGRVSSVEVRVGSGTLPRSSVAVTGRAVSGDSVATSGSRVETSYPAPPDTQTPTVRGQSDDSLRIPSLSDFQEAGQELVDGLSAETKQQISDAATAARQDLQQSLRDGTQAGSDYLTAEAQKLFSSDGSTTTPQSRLAMPSTSSSQLFAVPTAQGANAGTTPSTTAGPTTNPNGWGTTPSTNSNSTLTLSPSGSAIGTTPTQTGSSPTSYSGSTTYPQGSSSPYTPGAFSSSSGNAGAGTTPTTNPTTSVGLPNYPSTSSTFPTTSSSTVPVASSTIPGGLSSQDYWSLERALTKDQQAERDTRLLNEVGIGPGEVFIELSTQKELNRNDPRYAAMTDYMNRYYTYQRANSISSNASTLANPVSTGNSFSGGSNPTGGSSSLTQNNPLNNMTVSTPRPTSNPSTNPYFGGSSDRGNPTMTAEAWDEAVRKRAEEMLRWESNNPRLAQNAPTTNVNNGGLNGPINGGGNLGMPPSIAQGNQTTPVANTNQTQGAASGAGAGSTGANEASASDQKEPAGTGDPKRRAYEPQALVNFFLLLSIVGNIYLGIAISRLIRRYRNLVAVHRSGTVLSA